MFGQLVENSGVIHNPSNLSDHSPVYCQFNVNLVSKNVPSTRVSLPSKPSWGHSSESEKENFKMMLDQYLSNVKIPEQVSSCCDVHCSDPEHISATDDLAIATLHSVEIAARESLYHERTGPCARNIKRRIPGWTSLVQPYKEKSFFWHQVWQSAGSPLNSRGVYCSGIPP